MKNKHIREQIDEYLRGGLDHVSRSQVAAHLADCGGCRSAVAAARETSEVLGWMVPLEAPPQPGPEFYFRVQAAIEKEQSRGWLATLASTLQPRLVYPSAMMAVLMVAWMLSAPQSEALDGWDEMEYPSSEFAQMTFSNEGEAALDDPMIDNLSDALEVAPAGAQEE